MCANNSAIDGPGSIALSCNPPSGTARSKPKSHLCVAWIEAVFIRAPIIRRVGKDAHVLASFQGNPVLVEQGHHLVATFHPELTDDSRIHLIFLNKIP